MTQEIVIWNNASDDGTAEYLATFDDPRITVVDHPREHRDERLRTRSRADAAPYIVEVDDDVIEAPQNWDKTLLDAFQRIPNIGYLVADLKEDPNDSAYRYLEYVCTDSARRA